MPTNDQGTADEWEHPLFTWQLSNRNLKLSDDLVVPDMNSKVFGGKNGGEGFLFAYFDIVFSRVGREWNFLWPLGSLGVGLI